MVQDNMNIKKLIKYYILGTSLRDIELNRILDKISGKESLTDRETRFLELYQTTREDELKDFMLLSKNMVYTKVKALLDDNRTIICNLSDRDGKFGIKITNIDNNHEEDVCIITMKGGIKHEISDRYLYNIIYKEKSDKYSLEEYDEFHEKIEAGYED